jgi:hypothetical protein
MSPRAAIARSWPSVISAVLALLVGAALLAGLSGALAYLLPPLLLLLALALRRYPGERLLLALMGQRRRHPTCAGIRIARPKPRPRAVLPRGGDLIGSSLAVRPPPALVSVN